jgi:hypothetical protein
MIPHSFEIFKLSLIMWEKNFFFFFFKENIISVVKIRYYVKVTATMAFQSVYTVILEV